MFLRRGPTCSVSLGTTGSSLTLIVNQDQSDGTAAMGVSSFQRQAQTFTTTASFTTIQVSAPFYQRAGTVGGTYQFYIFAVSGDVPSGAALYTSPTLNYLDLPSSSPLPDRPTTYTATGLTLSDATTYAIAWYHLTGTGSDGLQLPVESSGSVYPGGNHAFDFSGGGTWTAAYTNDLQLLIEGA